MVEYVETGRMYLDGSVLVGASDGVVRDRIRMALNGHVTVTLVLDEDDTALGAPWADLFGLPSRGRRVPSLSEAIEDELADFLDRSPSKLLADGTKLDEGVRRVVRQLCVTEIGKRPEVTVVVSRLSEG